jgi:hypothetical protein
MRLTDDEIKSLDKLHNEVVALITQSGLDFQGARAVMSRLTVEMFLNDSFDDFMDTMAGIYKIEKLYLFDQKEMH